jgi:hypothetical protein
MFLIICQYMLMVGRTEDTLFEQLFSDLADWFICNPLPTWQQDLVAAANTPYHQVYRY